VHGQPPPQQSRCSGGGGGSATWAHFLKLDFCIVFAVPRGLLQSARSAQLPLNTPPKSSCKVAETAAQPPSFQ
jgi:hypothetical protein